MKTTITVTRVGESGAVDNGIGDPEVTFSGGVTSTGVYYSIKNNPGNSFTLTYSPTHQPDFDDTTLLLPDAYNPTSVEVDNDVTMRCRGECPKFLRLDF